MGNVTVSTTVSCEKKKFKEKQLSEQSFQKARGVD